MGYNVQLYVQGSFGLSTFGLDQSRPKKYGFRRLRPSLLLHTISRSSVADKDLKSYPQRRLKNAVDRNARKKCIRTFFGCLTKALEYLHQYRIHHKDIKPQNILVKSGEVYLTDFGTAKAHGETSRSISTGPISEWTPRYGAPEIANQDVCLAIHALRLD